MVHGRDLEARDATTSNDYALDDLGNDSDGERGAPGSSSAAGNGLLQDLDYLGHASPADKYGDYHSLHERLPPRLRWRVFLLVNGLAALIYGEKTSQSDFPIIRHVDT